MYEPLHLLNTLHMQVLKSLGMRSNMHTYYIYIYTKSKQYHLSLFQH